MRVVGTLAACALLGLAAPVASRPALAQVAPKKPISQDAYDIWRSIQGATLSNDGRWVVYSLSPAVGDGELVVRSTSGATEYRVPRGWLGRPVTSLSGGGGAQSLPPARITADSRWVIALTYAPMEEFERARRARPARGGRGGGASNQPKASLALVSLADGAVTTVRGVKSFALPEESGRWVAYLMEPADSAAAGRDSAAAAPNVAAAAPGGQPRPVAGDSATGDRRRRDTGSTLVIRDLGTGAEQRVENVTAFELSRDGAWAGYTIATRDSIRDGAYVRDLAAAREVALLTGPGNYKQLAFDEAGRQVAFVSDRDDQGGDDDVRYSLYHAQLGGRGATVAVAAGAAGDSLVVSDRASVSFVKDGSAVVFGLAPAPLDSIPADSLADKAVFDLWHYKDARLQPQQIVEAGRDRNRSYSTVYQVRSRRLTRLETDSLPNVTLSDDGRVGLAATSVPYAIEAMWGEGGNDVYLIDATTGERTLVAERISSRPQLSPGARYVIWFEDGRWFSHDVASGRKADLTGGLAGVRFDQETWDTPSTPAAWGVGGWTKGDGRVLLYDRYDVWEVDPSGRQAPRILTDSVGRRDRLVFRVVNLAAEGGARGPGGRFGGGSSEPLDPAQPLLLRVVNDETKASGFWEDRIGAVQPPRQIVMGERNFGTPTKARDADVLMLTQQTVSEFPDLWVGPSLTQLAKVTDANPQQHEYRWASVELVEWTSLDGVPLRGLLYKPEGFDPARKYPMVVYFYEKLSDNLHNYVVPAGRNVVNAVVYASHDYVVFMPDIAYTEGYPGQSALHSIVPGVQAVVARGFVDPDAIGTAGQSWGGYQTAHMITRTNIFKAAMAAAW